LAHFQRTIALFFTGWKHAGENIAEVLKQRARELPRPRKQAVEVVDNFPEECRYVLETLGGVYHYDALARKQELSPENRLRFHQEHSGPLMKDLHEWMEAQLAEHKTEPNSGLGKAISYLLNHWPKLNTFPQTIGRTDRQ
jgi:transposase